MSNRQLTRYAADGPTILDENVEGYTCLGINLNELEYEMQRLDIEARICECLGVPPSIIYGIPDRDGE